MAAGGPRGIGAAENFFIPEPSQILQWSGGFVDRTILDSVGTDGESVPILK